MDLNKCWKQLYEFEMCVRHDYHFSILDSTWDSYDGYKFILSPDIKELNLWI